MNYKLLKSLYYKDKEKYLDEYNKRIESVSTIKLKIKNKKDKNIVPEIGRNININQRKDKKGTRSYTKKGR